MIDLMHRLDHIVVAAPDLEVAKAEFARATGVMPADGGPHPGRGTRNALVSFGSSDGVGSYLEIIAPDPEQALAGTNGEKFACLSTIELLHWAVRTNDLESVASNAKQFGLAPGPIYPMSRATPQGERLNWRLMGLGGHKFGGLLPFYIDWLDCPHPALSAPMVGDLEEVLVSLPSSELLELLASLNDVQTQSGPAEMRVGFSSARGRVCYQAVSPNGFRF